MTDDLLKSVREVKACAFHVENQGARAALERASYCAACLRLVLAHCGERAAQVVGAIPEPPIGTMPAKNRELALRAGPEANAIAGMRSMRECVVIAIRRAFCP